MIENPPRALVTYDFNTITLHIYNGLHTTNPPHTQANLTPSQAILLAQQLLTQALLWQTHHQPQPPQPEPPPPNSAPTAMTPTSQVA